MAVAVVQNSAQRVQTHHASHAQRAHSSKSALLKLMALHQSVLPTATAMVQLVQSVHHMGKVATAGFQVMSVATLTIVRLAPMTVVVDLLTETAMTVRHALVTAIHVLHTETAMTAAHVVETVQLMVAQVQQQVAATVAK
jgi:hypothetical protein